jgi:methionyl-tRNA formyltransferase
MWLNAGIDAGSIITTEAIDIRNADNLNTAHIRVMDHAHDLYLRAIQYLATSRPPYSSVPQKNIGKGQLFLSKMWTAKKRKELISNWKRRSQASMDGIPVTIPLPDNKGGSFA